MKRLTGPISRRPRKATGVDGEGTSGVRGGLISCRDMTACPRYFGGEGKWPTAIKKSNPASSNSSSRIRIGIASSNSSRAARTASRASSPAAISKRSEEHTSELQSLMRHSYAVFCLKQKKKKQHI